MTQEQKVEEMNRRACFLNFLQGLFRFNPFERWTAKQAASHPFITNARYTGEFQPPLDPKVNERKLAYLIATQGKNPSANRNPTISSHTQSLALQGNKSEKSKEIKSKDDESQFIPLNQQSRRLTEPVQRSNNENRFEQGRPMLQRGQPVHEGRNSLKNQSPIPSPSQFGTNVPIHTGQEMYAHSPQMYNAYSASSPGNWAHQQPYMQLAVAPPGPPVYLGQQQQIYIQDSNSLYVNYPNAGPYIQAPQPPIYGQMYGQMASSHPIPGMFTHIVPSGYMLAGTSPGSYGGAFPIMASPGSYGAVSMQEMTLVGQPGGPVVMTDFGQAMTRPELDERRRLKSQQHHMQQAMMAGSYGHPSNVVRSFDQRSMEPHGGRQRVQRRHSVAVQNPENANAAAEKTTNQDQPTRRATISNVGVAQTDSSIVEDKSQIEEVTPQKSSKTSKNKEDISDALADWDPFFNSDDV
jgi:hypothetical protein